MTEQFHQDEVALRVIEGAEQADYVHHLKVRTDEQGLVLEVPEIDGEPFPGIESIAVFAAAGRPALAVVKLSASLDFEGHAVIVEETEPEPPQAA